MACQIMRVFPVYFSRFCFVNMLLISSELKNFKLFFGTNRCSESNFLIQKFYNLKEYEY
ncbi:MAG: hypothetical protein BWX87_00630 [Bacteroidetes bacterium ADurb.Bin123]|nr:MAG: hypothetical protein BWX87_00630 [Bacteroidetes bacterium ADurb.Bin123]